MPDNQESLVRDAEASDADRIARVHVDAWRQTYSGIVDERFFSEEAFNRRRRMWSRYLTSRSRTGSLVVAERAGEVVGFANAGPAVGPDAEHGVTPVRPEHLFSIYLLSAAQRSGLGQRMLDAVLEDRPAQLWVLRGNERAIGFYERNGFWADGVEFVDPADPGLVEIRMAR
ncbi:GNAT family N-acetyltransferase [Humibacter soli]